MPPIANDTVVAVAAATPAFSADVPLSCLLLLLLSPPSVAEDPDVQQQLWELWTQQTGAEWAPK
jgi:hypothetical protein